MKVQSNIGIINAMLRITCGLTMLAYFTSKMVRRPYKQSYILMAALAAMKVAEGIVRYCPMTAMYNTGQSMYSEAMDNMMDTASSFNDDMTSKDSNEQTYNPS